MQWAYFNSHKDTVPKEINLNTAKSYYKYKNLDGCSLIFNPFQVDESGKSTFTLVLFRGKTK